MKSDLVCVGVITKPVGVCGQVKIIPYTVSPHSFVQFKFFFFFDNVTLALEFPKIRGNGEIITNLKNYKTRNDVESLRLKRIYVKRDDLPPLPKDEYYLEDLRGLNVLDKNEKNIGIVNTVLDYGAGTFLDVKLIENTKPATIPFNKKSILDVNLDCGRIIVDDHFVLY
jgi:16S rRNA processing protein RimM